MKAVLIMGSTSDESHAKKITNKLDDYGIAWEQHAASAHKQPLKVLEILETKKNKTFIAKESNIFDEEKKVAETAPVEDIQMDDLTKMKSTSKKKIYKKNSFVLVVSDFFYLNSANNLKTELVKKTKISNFLVKKINNNVYRLSVGPFKSFNALKSAYISLNNLGFDELNVHIE